MNLFEHLQEIKRLSVIATETDKKIEEHKKAVKEFADSKGLNSLSTGNGSYYNKKWVPKLEFNKERAEALAKSKGYDPQRLTSPQIDPIKYEALVKLNVITEDELLSCYDDKGHARWAFSNKKLEEEN